MIHKPIVLLLSVLLVASFLPSMRCYRITFLDYEVDGNELENEVDAASPTGVDEATDTDVEVEGEDAPVVYDVGQDDRNVEKREAAIWRRSESPSSIEVSDLVEPLLEDDEEVQEAEGEEMAPPADSVDSEVQAGESVDSEVQTDESVDSEVQADEGDGEKPGAATALKYACPFNVLAYDPTCASDGFIYANSFELLCAQRENPTLVKVPCPGEGDEEEDSDSNTISAWESM